VIVLAKKQHSEEDITEEAMMNKQQTLLPKPVRMFSYVFFSVVLVTAVFGWIFSQH
jgi:hypothetical protein